MKVIRNIPAVLIASLCLGLFHAYAPPRENYHISDAKELSEAEAVNYLVSMQNSAFAESYVFRFKLKHYPYRARTITKYGTLYGQLDLEKGIQKERILIQERDPNSLGGYATIHDFLLIRSSQAQAWVYDSTSPKEPESISSSEDSTPSEPETPSSKNPIVLLEGNALRTPVLEGISLSYFDLVVPYFYWREYEYLGPNQIKARPTQDFKLYNPDTDSDLQSVHLHLDDEFKAILKADYLDANAKELKSMELVSFKKTGGTYIPKTIDYRDGVDKGNKTRIDIMAAATDVTLPDGLFSPENLGQPLPAIDTFVFDVF